MDKKEMEKKLEEDLRNYINDPSSAKPYFESMKELDKWLSELKK